jgi:hypothetical protein
VLLSALLLASVATAEDRPTALVIDRPSTLTVREGLSEPVVLDLPSGIFMPDATVAVIDAEMKRMSASENDLKAQNKHLGELLAQQPQGLGLKHLGIACGVGVVIGVVLTVVAFGAAGGI